MAEAKTDPTDDLPPKTGLSGWRLIVEDLFPAWCDRLGSSEDARDETYALLCDRETRSAKYRVDASGKEIPGTFSSLGPWFWPGRLLLEPDADGGVDRLVVDYMDYVDAYSVPGERMEFLVRHLDVERWERLYPELAAPPPAPSKEPTSVPTTLSEELSNKLRQKPGPKPDFNWGKIEGKCYDLMDHHGDFTPDDPDWDCQARLEEALMKFCQETEGRQPAPSTLREKLPGWLLTWRERKTGET
jgi:hypothetical protein